MAISSHYLGNDIPVTSRAEASRDCWAAHLTTRGGVIEKSALLHASEVALICG
jgi:hypothetical protein